MNEFEKTNIISAVKWLNRKKFKYYELLSMKVFFELHSKMFDKTWSWAGKLRQSDVNIGNTPVDQIQMRVKNILENTKYWIEHKTFTTDEICIRLHHQLVWIHPFANGNGRFSRIISDELNISLGGNRFSWGNTSDDLISKNDIRREYITALRLADKKDYTKLLAFAKS